MMRFPLGLAGVVAIGWGFWLTRDDGLERWQSQVTWFVGGIVVHDAVIAPLVVLLGVLAARVLRPRQRSAVAVGFIVWATVTVATANVLLPVGGRPDNPSLMNRPFVLAWLIFTASVLVAVVLVAGRGRGRDRPGVTT